MSKSRSVTLNCPNCGANLSVGPSEERFACSYCGATVAVERTGGGDVSLSSLGDVVQRLTRGSDKAAAEMAIKRLNEELAKAKSERVRHDQSAAAELNGFDESIAAAKGAPPRRAILFDTLAITIPLWIAMTTLDEHTPVSLYLASLVAAWFFSKHLWRVSVWIAGFVVGGALTIAVLAAVMIPLHDGGQKPPSPALLVGMWAIAAIVGLLFAGLAARRRSRRRKSSAEAAETMRASAASRLDSERDEIDARIRSFEKSLAKQRGIVDA